MANTCWLTRLEHQLSPASELRLIFWMARWVCCRHHGVCSHTVKQLPWHAGIKSCTWLLTRSLCVLLFTPLRTCSLPHSPPHSLAHSLTHPFTHSAAHSVPHVFTLSCSLPYLPTRSFTHSFTHPLTHALTHSLTHPLTHSTTHSS